MPVIKQKRVLAKKRCLKALNNVAICEPLGEPLSISDKKELIKLKKAEQKALEKKKERNKLIANSLINDVCPSLTATPQEILNNDNKSLEYNKRYKPYFKVYYKIGKGLSNNSYNINI